MKRRMEQLINGRFEYEVPELLLSKEEIRESTRAGENIRGELIIAAKDGSRIKGMVCSSHRRFLLGQERFSGERITIQYGADVKGLNPGDEIKGEIILSTGIGEYRVPFDISVKKLSPRTSTGPIKDLDSFAELAKRDFKEAYHLFLDESFAGLLEKEQEILPYYYAMTRNPVTWQHLEEFLIGIGRKEPVHLHLEKENLEIYEVQNSLKDTIRLRRSGWGYLKADVSVEGDFLEVDKKSIRDEDFISSVYELEYIIRRENLGKGKNYGRIRIRTVYQTLTYEVMASKSGRIQVNVGAYEKKKKLEILKKFLAFSLDKISLSQWQEETNAILTELKETGHYSTEYQLFEVYYHHLSGQGAKGRELLDKLKNNKLIKSKEVLEGVYLYLEDLLGCREGRREKMLVRLHQLYQRREDSYLLLYILLQTDGEAARTPSRKIYLLEEQYRLGCRSPFLYLEACRIAAEDGTMLRRISPFTIQVLLFAKRHGLMSEEMAFRATDLAGQMKEFSQKVYEILEYVYDKYPSTEVVRAVCMLIMKGDPRKKEYFRWYELAVEKELKITRLYEYYIETMSRNYQKILPRIIRMYFSYNNTLSDTKKAFVYSNVIRNKELDKTTYASYQASMQMFACEKLKEGRMSEDFAVVYQEFCIGSKEPAVRRALAKVLFTHRIYCDDPKIRRVIVRHAALKEEQAYTCTDKVAYVSLYTRDARIIFEDDRQRRYIQTVDYNIQPLLESKELARQLLEEDCKEAGLLLHTCGELNHENAITKENIRCFQNAALEESFSEEYRQRIRKRLLLYYEEHMENDNLRDSLREMDFHGFAKVNKSLLITILVKQGMYLGAYDLLCEYGYEDIDIQILLRLCSRMVQNLDFEYEEELLLLAHYIFCKGTYDEVVLGYLARYFEGPVSEMLEVWERAMGFSMEAYELEEDILLYSMFTRQYPAQGAGVLKDYMAKGGREQVILAWLSFSAFQYFVGEKDTDDFIFQSLEQLRKSGSEYDIICDLALLKSYARKNNWDEEKLESARCILNICVKTGLKFAFFQELPGSLLQSLQLDDKVFAECHAGPRDRVTLYFAMDNSGQWDGSFKSEPLKNRYHGIFNKEFILFYGEKLHYYFAIETEEGTRQTEKQILTVPGAKTEGSSKYHMINRMLAARQQGREAELEKILNQYRQQEAWVTSLFKLIDDKEAR